ncbi:hypothetical protein V1478_006084 [Vespula squamosa]|uniref:Uncharacterized protein n=1 Tax=Vespula squamosa TaxID=30214 RepID=A0ABD2B6V9_VESSQ
MGLVKVWYFATWKRSKDYEVMDHAKILKESNLSANRVHLSIDLQLAFQHGIDSGLNVGIPFCTWRFTRIGLEKKNEVHAEWTCVVD